MSRQTFVIYSANIFAILGLRAIYLLLANTIAELPYLHYGLAIVFAFAGVKLLADPFIEVPPLVSVGFTAVVIGATVWFSIKTGQVAPRPTPARGEESHESTILLYPGCCRGAADRDRAWNWFRERAGAGR
jgi:tellurite resistance protein TerC